MALVSSQWGAGRRILCHLQADVLKKLDGHHQNIAGTTVWGSDGSSCSRAASFSASAVALERGRVAGCGRTWILRRERRTVFDRTQSMRTRARSVVPSAAVDGKGLCVDECAGKEGLFDKFLQHAVQAVAQREDVSPLPCQVRFSF